MNIERAVRKANDLLRQEFGESPTALPNFAWGFSEPNVYDTIPGVAQFWNLIPEYDVDGEPQYDYHCSCGVNINVHSPMCGGSVAKVRLIQQKIAWNIQSQWLLGRWLPAPPQEVLEALDSTVWGHDPKGRHIPFRINHINIACPERRLEDLPLITDKFIKAWRQDQETRQAQYQAMLEAEEAREWKPPRNPDGTPDIHYQPGGIKGSMHSEIHEKIKESMLFKGKQPGKKDHVSWGFSPTDSSSPSPSSSPVLYGPDNKPI